MNGTWSTWNELRAEIRQSARKAKELDAEVTEALYRYRFHLTELQAKPHKLDEKIWKTYDSIVADIRQLEQRSEGRLLRKPSSLASLYQEWNSLFDRQQGLVHQINQTIERSDFYNKMETAKEDKSRRERLLARAQAVLSNARRSLIQGVHYVLLRERSGETITAGSIVLDLDRAIAVWEEQLREILHSQMERQLTDEEEIYLLASLRQQIVEAPGWAERVRTVERKLDELLVLEDQLRRISGTGELSDGDIGEVVNLLQSEVNEYWVDGRWEELEEVIGRIEAYVQRELPAVHSQLYVFRKRSGDSALTWGGLAAAGAAESVREGSADQGSSSLDGSILKTLAERLPEQMGRKVHIDPDADESVRLVYREQERPANQPLDSRPG